MLFRAALLALGMLHARGVVTRQGRAPPEHRGAKFDLVINTFQRDKCLKKIVKHYRNCVDVVDTIHVAWNEPAREPPEWLSSFAADVASDVRVVIDRNEGKNLTNRFKPRKFSSTVFSQDDDLYYSCDVLAAGFKVWQQYPTRVVGFGPRWVPVGAPIKETTDAPYNEVWKTAGRTNVVLPTKGGWLDQKYYKLFFSPSNAHWRDMIDGNRTAEDFFMALLVADSTKLPPIPLVLHSKDVYTLGSCGDGSGLTGKHSGKSSRANRAPLFKFMLDDFSNGLYPTTEFIDPLKAPDSWKVDPWTYDPV